MAEALSVSEAMIVKVSKLLGFSGFRNLRSALVEYFSQSEQVLPAELSFDEAPQDVVNKVLILPCVPLWKVSRSLMSTKFIARHVSSPGPTSAICTVPVDQMPSAPMCSYKFYVSACAARHIRMRIS